MIGQVSNDVIIHMVMEPSTVRFQGQDRFVLRPGGQGFCWAEFDDGNWHPISHPLETFFLDIANQIQAGNSGVGTIHFVIDPPGDRSTDGQDERTSSVNNIQTVY